MTENNSEGYLKNNLSRKFLTEPEEVFDACIIVFNEITLDARAVNIAQTLSDAGKSVCIIAIASPGVEETFSLKGILLCPVSIQKSKRMWKRWLSFLNAAKKYPVHARTYWASDLYSLPAALRLKDIFTGKVIYDSREIFSALGPAAKTPVKQRIISALEKRWIVKTDEFIVSGKLDADYLRKYFGTGKPFHVIMNVPFYKKPAGSRKIREYFNLPGDKKIILYQGVLLDGRGLIPVVQSLKYFDDAVLCIIGDGPFRRRIEEESFRLNFTARVLFKGSVPYNELHEWTSSADAGLCFIEPISFSYQLALPNKLFEYIMARIPVLASDLPAIKKIIDEENTGIALSSKSSPEQIAAALKELCRGDRKASFLAACNKAALKYSYENQINKILKIAEE